MKKLFAILALVALLAVAGYAQEREQSGMIKTARGVLVVWNEPGNYYTIEIEGNKIIPAEQPLLFQVDGMFFQIQTVAKKAFLQAGDEKRFDDKAILAAHRDWEGEYLSGVLGKNLQIDSESLKLDGGRDALAWSYDMPKAMVPDGSAKKQFYLAIVKRDHVLLLNSALTNKDDVKVMRQLLTDTINTTKSTDKPLPLQQAAEMIRKVN